MGKTYLGVWAGRRVLGVVAIMLGLGISMAQAQAPTWQMAVNGTNAPSGTGISIMGASAIAANGDVVVAGAFTGQLTLGNTVLTSMGSDDIFVAKWSALTNVWAWATRDGGTGSDYANDVAISGSNVYVTGVFGSGGNARIAGSAALPGAGNSDMFVAKYLDLGAAVSPGWAISGGGPSIDYGNGIAVNGSSVYVTGSFGGTAPVRIAGTVLAGLGDADIFLAKFTDTGLSATDGWAVSGGGANSDIAYGVAATSNGVYIAGYLTAGPTVRLAGSPLASPGGLDMFVAKYVDNGTTAANGWAVSGGGRGDDRANKLVANGTSLYVTGHYSVGTATIAGTVLPNSSSYNMFVAKYTDTGPAAANGWATGGGGVGINIGYDLAVSGNAVYVTGFFDSSISARIAGTAMTGAGNAEIFWFSDNFCGQP